MKIDLYTKVILPLILLVLCVLTFKTFSQPPVAHALSSQILPTLQGVEATFGGTGLWFFDKKNGRIYAYSMENPHSYQYIGRLPSIGGPMLK